MYCHFHIRPQLIEASVNAALLLFKCLTAKLTQYYYLNILLISMTIILLSLSNLDQSLPDAKDKVKEVLDKGAQSLKGWAENEKVVSRPLFGGRVVNDKLSHPMQELKVCISVFLLHA